jgi:hypothetical protein
MPSNGEKNEKFEILQDEDTRMRLLSALADDYERWAAEDDAIVLRIMSNANELGKGVRAEQLRLANRFAAAEDDAIVLRMMNDANEFADGVRHEQLRLATRLAEEARNLRDVAKGLRRSVAQQLSISTRPA